MANFPRYVEIPFYRTEISSELFRFRVVVKQTDLYVLAERDLTKETLNLVRSLRAGLEGYLQKNPYFLRSLVPLPFDPEAPDLVKDMLWAGERANVGPMASVAGAIAERVGRALIAQGLTKKVVVENGGDIYLALGEEARVKIFSGSAQIAELKILLPKELQPCGVCTSSGKIGHSLSFGRADAVTVIAKDTAFADAMATALANLLQKKEDLKILEREVKRRKDLLGVVAIFEDRLFLYGKIKIFI